MINQETEASMSNIDKSEVSAALHAILSTDKFSASPQMSAFLRYVVEQTLLGNTRRIKAFTVGIEALGKPASFDPQTDPSVRVLAKRLRSSLDTYYLQNPDTLVFIEMKPGSYIPKFLLRSEMNIQAGVPAANRQMLVESYKQATSLRAPATQSAQPESAPQQPENTVESTPAEQDSGINHLWQAYKSSSKVA